jgi:hypothetical protein
MNTFVADFETTKTIPARVWAWGICSLERPDLFLYGTGIESFMELCREENRTIYFHNERFDGQFIIYHLLTKMEFTYSEKRLSKTFNVLINEQGQFFQIEVIFKRRGRNLERVIFQDSYKKLPFSVETIAKAFKLPIQKGSIDHDKERPEGYEPDENEISYLRNDCQIVAQALKIQYDEGLTRMTIGADSLAIYKEMIGQKEFKTLFPTLTFEADESIRSSYRGGYTYLHPNYAGCELPQGIVLDRNSMYPTVMKHELMPYGVPVFFYGQYVPNDTYPLYTQKIFAELTLKKGHVPTVQIKDSFRFLETEYVTDTGVKPVEMVLTNIDLELLERHYVVTIHEYLGGWMFKGAHGLFDQYIDYWTEIKEANAKEKNALYTLAKLMLNNLYGKFGQKLKVKGKYPVIENDIVKYKDLETVEKDGVYIPIASFVTAYARRDIICEIQKVYNRFIYADTDSLHILGTHLPENMDLHPSRLGAWDKEKEFIRAKYIHAKTYVQESHFRKEMGRYWLMGKRSYITCAGMPANVKRKVSFARFEVGLTEFGKLVPKNVPGGSHLVETYFTIRKTG